MKKTLLAMMIATASSGAYAIDPFTPLSPIDYASAGLNQATKPFALPAGWKATFVTDRATLSAQDSRYDWTQADGTYGNWDMIAVDGANIYIPFEVQQGAGLARYDRNTGIATTLISGNNTGIFESDPSLWNKLNDDFGAFDPATYTPFGTVVTGEEWAGNGRMFEVLNPGTATGVGDANARWLSSIPSVSHEGIRFDGSGNMYFVDEDHSGSVYKFTPKTAGDLSVGQTFVLSVDNFASTGGVADETAYTTANSAAERTGDASWVAMTDADGNPLGSEDPFDYANRGGRSAADEAGGTPYGRPEDLAVRTLADGREALVLATTGEDKVYTIALNADGATAEVITFVDSNATPDNLGNDPIGNASGTTYGLNNPDNVAVDIDGDVFIIEDQNPGDVWLAHDVDGDGMAESVDLFVGLGEFGSEPTGFIFDPFTGGYLISIQHPSDGNDAIWSITQEASVVPIPAAAWLFGSAVLGLVGVSRRKRA